MKRMTEPRIISKVLAVFLLVSLLLITLTDAAESQKRVIFNFVAVDLPVIAKFVSDVTGKNFIFDETFKGQVTIIAPTKINADDVFKLFTSVLQLKGFTVIPTEFNAYKIVRTSVAKQEGVPVKTTGEAVNEAYIARLVPLKYISAEDAVNFLKPTVSRDGYVASFGPGNAILVIDSGANIEKLLSILDLIDQPSTMEVPEIVFLKYAGAEDIAKMVNEGSQAAPGVPRATRAPGGPSSGRVVPDTRLNAVIIFGPKEVRESLKRLIAVLDVPSEESQSRINIYSLENGNAEEIAKVLQGVIKGVQETKPGQPNVSAAIRRQEDIIVTPDKSTNSLVIVASPAEYRNLAMIIKKLDKRKRQVYVEAMIVEASISNLLELGSRWRIIAQSNGEPVVIGGVGVVDQTEIQSIITGLAGASIGGMGNFMDIPVTTIGQTGTVSSSTLTVPGFAALFSLQEFKDAVNVLSTPQILTSDNQEAEILVGENVPFITKRESVPSSVSVVSDVQRQDVGVKLKITPQIAKGDYVRLDLYQEISSVNQESNAQILISVGPTTTKRSTKTTVVVKDKQTVVIGGLMQERMESTVTKVPLLGDIPLIGWLFKFKSKTKQKTNLFVFLTPHIIRSSEDLNNLTKSKSIEYAQSQNMYVPGELLVRFKPGVERETIEKILKEEKSSVIMYLEKLDLYVIRLPEDVEVEDAAKTFSKLPEVQFAEPNYQFIPTGKSRAIDAIPVDNNTTGYPEAPSGNEGN